MKKYLLLFIICAAINSCNSPTLDSEQIYKKVNDAVVTIYAYDSYEKTFSQGSGVVLNDKGWIVTNYHVYNGSDLIVKHNGKTIKYTDIIGVDTEKDILILKIADYTFPSISIGNSDHLNVGQKIYAVGSPLGLENTITDGIISGFRSNKANSKNFIQISAAISHGSSGGAIVNTKGELIGISSLSIVEGQNLNFAIPVKEVLNVYKKEGVDKNDLASAYFLIKGIKEYKAGNYRKAIVCFKNGIANHPDYAESYFDLGMAYGANRDPNAEIYCYKKAITIDSNYAEAYYYLGYAYFAKDDNDAAIYYFRRDIALRPDDASAYYYLGKAYAHKGDNYNFKLNLEKAYQLDPSLKK